MILPGIFVGGYESKVDQTAGALTEFKSLFDGKTLAGWKIHNGLPGDEVYDRWMVEDGAIVGMQDPPGKGGC